VNQKVDINAKTINNETPLHYASYHGHLGIVEFLINLKADINAEDHYYDILNIILFPFI